MKKSAFILPSILCAVAFAQSCPETTMGEINRALISPSKHIRCQVKNNTVAEAALEARNKIFILPDSRKLMFGDATSSGEFSFEGPGDQDISAFSVKVNPAGDIKPISAKKAAADFYNGPAGIFGKCGTDCIMDVADESGMAVPGKAQSDTDASRNPMACALDSYWELAKADDASHFTSNWQTCVVTSDLGSFEIGPSPDGLQTYPLKSGD